MYSLWLQFLPAQWTLKYVVLFNALQYECTIFYYHNLCRVYIRISGFVDQYNIIHDILGISHCQSHKQGGVIVVK